MISPYQYFDVLNSFLLLIIVIGFVYYNKKNIFVDLYRKSPNILIYTFFVLPIIFFLGLRPITDAFGDMSNYERYFLYAKLDNFVLFHDSDVLFAHYIKICSKLMDVKIWFFLTAFITITVQFIAIKRLFPNSVFIFFLASLCSLTFYGAVVNGLRIGMASSFFLLGLSFMKKKYWMILLFIISIGLHKSMLLPSIAAILAIFFNQTKYFIYLWVIALIISLFSTSVFSEIFNRIQFVDSRLDLYDSSKINPSKFSVTGFRYDFVLYSLVPLAIGYYYLVKDSIRRVYKPIYHMTNSNGRRNRGVRRLYYHMVKDSIKRYHYKYVFLLNTYIITNAFWILIIEANYSNRFASLSWILWPFIAIYPVLYILKNKYRYIIAFGIILFELAVTYFIS